MAWQPCILQSPPPWLWKGEKHSVLSRFFCSAGVLTQILSPLWPPNHFLAASLLPTLRNSPGSLHLCRGKIKPGLPGRAKGSPCPKPEQEPG